MQGIRERATFANVMATVAVFVSLGGTSYAALALPRDSVGQRELQAHAVGVKELRRGAVTSRAIKNGGIHLADLSGQTRQALAGKPGPAGPPGSPAVTLRVAVNSGGDPIAGGTPVSNSVPPNKRLLHFSRSLAGCVPTATLARNAGGATVDPGAGHIVVGIEGDRVAVETYDVNHQPSFLPFNLIVAC